VVEHVVVVTKVGNKKIHLAVVFIVPRGNAHRGDLAAVVVERKPGQVTVVFERPIAFTEAFIDVEDIASVAATALADPQAHAGMAYSLTGPEALTVAEAAAIISGLAVL